MFKKSQKLLEAEALLKEVGRLNVQDRLAHSEIDWGTRSRGERRSFMAQELENIGKYEAAILKIYQDEKLALLRQTPGYLEPRDPPERPENYNQSGMRGKGNAL